MSDFGREEVAEIIEKVKASSRKQEAVWRAAKKLGGGSSPIPCLRPLVQQ
jgi:hypothetical protein